MTGPSLNSFDVILLGPEAAISAGVAFAHSLPERRLRFAFCGLLVLIAALLALHG
ncbi:MAG: hypothetical protein WCA23_10195 [Stellaceae bacterium]